MATIDDPRPVLRQELARVFKNPRVIRAFEKIFDLVPPEFINQQVQIDEVNLSAEYASSAANDIAAAVNRLADAVELLAMMPRQELGTMSEQQNDSVDIKAGTVVAALSDNTANLLASTTALTNAAGAAAGTLLNAPTAGNPTKWVQINDNGTIRKIPTWL